MLASSYPDMGGYIMGLSLALGFVAIILDIRLSGGLRMEVKPA